MAKFTDIAVLDAALAKVATCTRMSLTTAQPANFAGIAAVSVGNKVLTAGLGGVSFGAAVAGDVSGRKTPIAAQTGISITAAGTVNHICLDDAVTLLQVTTVTAQAVTAGNTAATATYDVEFAAVTP